MTNFDTNEQQKPRFRIPLWAWAAAIIAVLSFALTLWQAQKLQRRLAELQVQVHLEQNRKEQLEAQKREMDQIRALLAAPETHAVQLKATAVGAPPFKIFWNEEMGLLVTAQNIPATPPNRVLQLWILPRKGSPVSAGVFQPKANENLMKLTRATSPIHVRDAAALMITEEPAGGSSQPSSKPAWVATIH